MYNTKEGKSCVIYIRVSSERQVKGYSLDGQKHYLAECAERRGMTVLDTYVEEGKSGKSIEGRTEFQRMLDDIQSGVYQVGQKLPSEREVMDEFGVGRPAVREALSGLARMGLIEVSPGMRARVCRLTLKPLLREMRATLEIYSSSPDGWRQLHDLRLFFETAVVRRMALEITDEQLTHLDELLQNQRRLLDASEIRAFAEADIDFHRYLVECMGNNFLGLLAEGFAGWLITPLYASLQVRKQSERSYRAHVGVYEALKKRDPDLAEKAMRTHLDEMRGIYQVDVMVDEDEPAKDQN